MPNNTSLTTRMPGGVTNAAPWQTMADAGTLDPTWAQEYLAEFNTLNAADLTQTLVGTGTNALTPEVGGVLLVTTTAGATDANYYQVPVAGFQLLAGRRHFFKARMKPSDASLSALYAGFIMTSATPLTANDGLFFLKASGAATWVLRSIIGGVATNLTIPAALVAVNAAYIELGFMVDGNGDVYAYINPTTGATTPRAAGSPTGFVAKFTPTLTQAMLAPSFGILNGAAAAKTLSVDYIVAQSNR